MVTSLQLEHTVTMCETKVSSYYFRHACVYIFIRAAINNPCYQSELAGPGFVSEDIFLNASSGRSYLPVIGLSESATTKNRMSRVHICTLVCAVSR